MVRVWKGAILVCGEPGTGKSHWIREEAAASRARLFRWNVRMDRSLREGREILHQQVRSKERMFVWIEGADDLTQEAQAFLRRILETAAPNVTCVLEVREMWKMSPPILSRCTIHAVKSDISVRNQRNTQRAISLGLLPGDTARIGDLTWKSIPAARNAAADPFHLFQEKMKAAPITTTSQKDLIEAWRAIGAGSSPWVQLTNYLMRQESA